MHISQTMLSAVQFGTFDSNGIFFLINELFILICLFTCSKRNVKIWVLIYMHKNMIFSIIQIYNSFINILPKLSSLHSFTKFKLKVVLAYHSLKKVKIHIYTHQKKLMTTFKKTFF